MDGIPLGPVFLRWNGLLIIFGLASGGILAAREVRRRGLNSEIILDLVVPLLIWGTLGARLWHVFTPPISSIHLGLTTRHYLTHPLDLIAVWVGGLGFPGVILGGSIGLLIFCVKNGLRFSEWADILSPALALGYTIGRFGNYINQELYGLPSNAPWKIFIAPENRLTGYEAVNYYHPLFAYDMILSLLTVVILIALSRRDSEKSRNGDVYVAYLLLYGMTRFGLEYIRLDVSLIEKVNINQLFSLLMVIGSAVYLLYRKFRHIKL